MGKRLHLTGECLNLYLACERHFNQRTILTLLQFKDMQMGIVRMWVYCGGILQFIVDLEVRNTNCDCLSLTLWFPHSKFECFHKYSLFISIIKLLIYCFIDPICWSSWLRVLPSQKGFRLEYQIVKFVTLIPHSYLRRFLYIPYEKAIFHAFVLFILSRLLSIKFQ